MSLADTIDTFGTGTYTVTRTAAGARTGGMVAQGAQSTFSVEASVVPAGGRSLQVMAHGVRAEEIRTLYTKTPLKVLEPECDVVTIDGEGWRAFQCKRWDVEVFGDPFYEVLVSRIAQP